MKHKSNEGIQQNLSLRYPKDTKSTVVEGRFAPHNKHLDSVQRRLSGSGIFTPKKPLEK